MTTNDQSTDLSTALNYLAKEIYHHKKNSPEYDRIKDQIDTVISLIINNTGSK